MFSIALILPLSPVTSITSVSALISMIFARNIPAICRISALVPISAATLISASPRSTDSDGGRSDTEITSISLESWLITCASTRSSPSTTIVIRDISGFSVMPTARLSILYPRLLKSPETRASTPGLFSTSTASVCLMLPPPGRGSH